VTNLSPARKPEVFGLAVPGIPAPNLTTPHPSRCRGSTFMAPRAGRLCLPLNPSHRFRRRLTIWPVAALALMRCVGCWDLLSAPLVYVSTSAADFYFLRAGSSCE
jgi:hypothetical protein